MAARQDAKASRPSGKEAEQLLMGMRAAGAGRGGEFPKVGMA